eukprot:c23487_g1_i1 orf=224-1483(-)
MAVTCVDASNLLLSKVVSCFGRVQICPAVNRSIGTTVRDCRELLPTIPDSVSASLSPFRSSFVTGRGLPSVSTALWQAATLLSSRTSFARVDEASEKANAAQTYSMDKPGVLVTLPMSIPLLTALEERFTVFRLWEAPDQSSFLAEHGHHIRGVVGNTIVGANAELIDSLPNLEIVSSYSVGLDKVDLTKCRERGIVVTNTPEVLTDDVADLAILLMLAALRRLGPAERYLRRGLWHVQGPFPLARKASGKRVGIVGLGRIGLATARRAEAFGCSIAYQGRSSKPGVPYVYYANIVDLATNSDVLIVCCPLTEETRHFIGRKVFNALGPEGALINVARGPIIDEDELVKALDEGRLGAAGLDVYENEPYVSLELLKMDNVVLVPHIGSATQETRKVMAELVLGNLDAHFSGKQLLTPIS